MRNHQQPVYPLERVSPETARRVTVTEADLLRQLARLTEHNAWAGNPAMLLRMVAYGWMKDRVYDGTFPRPHMEEEMEEAYVSVFIGKRTDTLVLHYWTIEHGGWTFIAENVKPERFPRQYVEIANQQTETPLPLLRVWMVLQRNAPEFVP